eukprot:617916-Pleurochrysis_carterae.AAC.1
MSVGTIVQVSVADVDHARVDDMNVTVNVVEQASKQAERVGERAINDCIDWFMQVEVGEISMEIKYRLACKAGVIKTLYGRSNLRAFVDQTPAASRAPSRT